MKSIALAIVILLWANFAISAELSRRHDSFGTDDAFCPRMKASICFSFNLSGNIIKGDAKKLAEKIDVLHEINETSARVGAIYVDSIGGDVFEAMEIGQILRNHKIQAVVPLNSRCYSACALLVAGAVGRFSFGETAIHSFCSLSSTHKDFNYSEEDKMYQQMVSNISNYLQEMRIPRQLLDEMVNVPATNLRVLTFEEKQNLSLIGIDPLFHQYLVTNGYLKNETRVIKSKSDN